MLTRRSLIAGLIAAPAIVRFESLMKIVPVRLFYPSDYVLDVSYYVDLSELAFRANIREITEVEDRIFMAAIQHGGYNADPTRNDYWTDRLPSGGPR